jgi:glycosyltransferase involved in cell wall biosynthesis
MADPPPLTVFTPLPPARNGIADYAALLLRGLQGAHYACTAAVEAWDSTPCPVPGVPVLDHLLAHRHVVRPGGRVLHQLGNNLQHGFVLRALRAVPGVTTLHDPGLLHLHEVTGEAPGSIRAGMAAAPAPLGPVLARHLRDRNLASRASHAVCDLAGEVLARSRAVIVHSRFAAARLRALHGAARTAHVAVVPHMLPARRLPEPAAARAGLGISPGVLLIVTAGFATRAKRFDWLIEALEAALAAGTDLAWIHAGAERQDELDLSGLIARGSPALRARARVTGWLDEAALDAHIAAADLLVNLRFPSLGESSGPLALGLAAGTCCLVSDTAAYAELPRDAVLHIPVIGAARSLAAALNALAGAPALRHAIGRSGRAFAEQAMAPAGVAAAYADIIERSRDRPVHAPVVATEPPVIACHATAGAVEQALAGVTGPCRLFIGGGMEAPVTDLLPAEATLLGVRVMLPPAMPGLLLDIDLPAWRA